MIVHWLECRFQFEEIAWDDLAIGDEIFYYIPKKRKAPEFAHGPFVVVDPKKRKLRNQQGVEVCLPSVQPVLPSLALTK
jgi:hypothetical protein